MTHKKLIASILIVCLILLCAGIILVLWLSISRISTSGIHLRLFNLGQFSAETDREWSFKADGPTKLVVDSSSGNIDIVAGEGNEIKVTAHITTWGYTSKLAENALVNIIIEVKQEGNQVILRYKSPEGILRIGSTQFDAVDFTVSVPEECSVNASTNIGKITMVGTVGDADLHSDFGNLSVSDMEGNLSADTNSGDIYTQRIEARQKTISLETEFGVIELEQVRAHSIEARTNNGKVDIEDIGATGEVTLHSSFGDIQIMDSSCISLTIDTSSGKISINGINVRDMLVASSDFGDIAVEQVNASGYDLSTNSGNISIHDGFGSIKAYTEFGGIVISGAKNADLVLRTKSGEIEFSGSLGDGPHSLKAEFGNIHLTLPENTRLTFDLKTEYGKLESVFPITLSGEVEGDHWKGTINGGGAVLQAQTNNGNIKLDLLTE